MRPAYRNARRSKTGFRGRFRLSNNETYGSGFMANTTSAKKASRKIARRTKINTNRRSRMRTLVRKVEEAITGGDAKLARAALQAAEPAIVRAAQNGVIHRNTASRTVSRLTARVKKLG